MRKLLLILLMMCGVFASAKAQDIRTLFMDAPDEVLPLLPRNARADCIDFADAGMAYPVSNLLGGESTLKVLTGNYLLLQTTSASTMEMKVLPCGDSFVICVIKSVSAEATDSRVSFYTSDWKKVDTALHFKEPQIRDFFTDDSELLDMCDIYLVSLKPAADDNVLVAEYTMPNYMDKADAEKVRALLKKISYRWDGARFVKE